MAPVEHSLVDQPCLNTLISRGIRQGGYGCTSADKLQRSINYVDIRCHGLIAALRALVAVPSATDPWATREFARALLELLSLAVIAAIETRAVVILTSWPLRRRIAPRSYIWLAAISSLCH